MALQEEMEKQGNFLFKYRGSLPLLILGIGFLIYLQSVHLSIIDYNSLTTQVYELLCLSVCLFGLLIRVYAVSHSPKNTSGRNTKRQLAEELNTSGIYSLVRHPLYVGNFFMWLGIGILTQSLWFIVAFVFAYWVYYERIMFAEEQFLRRKFGNPYLEWAEKIPAFIPDFKNWKAPVLPFSWKKMVKKEKNGVFAIFLVVFLFREAGQYLISKTISVDFDFWFWAMSVSGVLYFILKVLKKRTPLLKEKGR